MDVEYPGFGTIVVDGTRYDHDVVIDDGTVRPRNKKPSRGLRSGHTPLSVAEDIPWSKGRLIIGTGYSGRLPVLSEVEQEAADRGVQLEAVPTSEACARLRSLEMDDVNAILHVTC